jgi:endonuclease/exonuclease/phosphatase family metal-dependent hydrolase
MSFLLNISRRMRRDRATSSVLPPRSRRAIERATSNSRFVLESVESRLMLSTTTLRIVAYNIEDDIDGNTTPLPGLYQVLEGIGEEKVQGNVRPIDILGLEETTSNADVEPIVTNLNSYYNGAAVYAESPYQGTQDGGNTDGNGPNALVYNTSTLNLLASVGIVTPEGSTNGVYRQPVRYEFQPVGDTGTTGIFYVYVAHTKSGTTSADATARGEEATIIRNDEANLPASASVIYMGDLNSAPPEAEFTNFTSPTAKNSSGQTVTQGEAYDPANFSTSVQYFSESDTDLSYRDDYQLMTSNVLNDTGAINLVSGSFHVFANNDTTPSGGSVDSGSDTALNSDLVTDGGTFISASTIYADLTTASDHLPVVSDYTISSTTGTPAIGSFAASPSSVNAGTATTLTATNVTESGGSGTITGVNFYRESNGTSGLQIGSDTLVGAGTENGTTWTISASTTGLTAGTYTYYAVATDSNGNSSAVSSTTLTVTAPGTPTIGSFVANPSSVTVGATTTLTASSVTETGGTGTITGVNFYRESNGTSGLQIGSDTLVGAGTANGTTWTISASTTGLAAGTYTYYAVATDSNGNSSAVSSTTLTVTSSTGTPTIGSFVANPSSVTIGATTTLTASSVTETGGTGTITGVNFYRESNGTSGLQIGSDTLVGAGTANGTTWTISASTTGLAAGTYTYYAVATDSNGNSSAVASTTLTVTSSSSTPIHGTVLAWDTDKQTAFGTQDLLASTVATGATDSTGLTRGSGVSTSGTGASNAWGGDNWASTSAAGISGSEYVTFGFTISSGYTTSLSSISMNYRRSSTGPTSGYWQYQINGGAWVLIGDFSNQFSSTSSSGAAITPISLTGISALQNLAAGTVVNFRVTPYGATGSSGTWYVYDGGNNTNDLVVTAS